MRIEHLEYLLEVAASESISSAAKKLFIGQSTLSAIINSIEKKIDTQIFIRTHTGVKLTPKGQCVVAISEDIVKKNHELINISSTQLPLKKKISISAYPAACNVLGLYLSNKLYTLDDRISLHMHESVSSKIVNNIIENISNIGIGASSKYEFFNSQYVANNNGFLFEPIYMDDFCLCVNKASILANHDEVDISELVGEHLAVTESHYISSSSSIGCMLKYPIEFSIFSNNETVKQAVIHNNMVAILPRLFYYQDSHVESGDLILIPITGFDTRLTNFLVINEKHGLNKLERTTLSLIHDFFNSI